ncbi:MAG TPA: hypothetical protein VK843_16280 [Planctomycetota bacterium]|nr:hypothetical protein [Planctomycetota bacterium]
MAMYLISYDLNQPGQAYHAIDRRLGEMSAVRALRTVWLVDSGLTAEQIRDSLLATVDQGDSIVVAPISGPLSQWKLQPDARALLQSKRM